MQVSEIFLSIQGESSFTGLPCVFIRLAGCNLGCEWCDTDYARTTDGSRRMTVDEVLEEVSSYGRHLVEITGGEPLMQDETVELARRLVALGKKVLVETNGSAGLGGLPSEVVKIVDVKCPSSGFAGTFLTENLPLLSADDEVKFVMKDREDFDFAVGFYEENLRDIGCKVLFAPVTGELHPDRLAGWILDSGLDVRLQVQVHRYIWKETRGR